MIFCASATLWEAGNSSSTFASPLSRLLPATLPITEPLRKESRVMTVTVGSSGRSTFEPPSCMPPGLACFFFSSSIWLYAPTASASLRNIGLITSPGLPPAKLIRSTKYNGIWGPSPSVPLPSNPPRFFPFATSASSGTKRKGLSAKPAATALPTTDVAGKMSSFAIFVTSGKYTSFRKTSPTSPLPPDRASAASASAALT
mmetsp:Transcript_73161/g.208463  ORF Transcript_73161/g.208463 Transcript_73161/m.208463 type:complete len:201 (-) Transcript_73161:23-625(-)